MLYADWLSGALSGHASMNKDMSQVLTSTVRGNKAADWGKRLHRMHIWHQIKASAFVSSNEGSPQGMEGLGLEPGAAF